MLASFFTAVLDVSVLQIRVRDSFESLKIELRVVFAYTHTVSSIPLRFISLWAVAQ
jgi:hypothetical protein